MSSSCSPGCSGVHFAYKPDFDRSPPKPPTPEDIAAENLMYEILGVVLIPIVGFLVWFLFWYLP